MTDKAIQVEGLSKRFHIGKLKSGSVREALASAMKAPFRRKTEDEDTILWALRDVSFSVKPGEVVGLIGRNGAGKSTLLKILARITRPTSGWAEVHGRIGSLLEVGTGFHHELSGRENIFLSGAVLGMKKSEIEKKFDEIVAFSEIERFLDTPLKHYSSGMQMRLAFAVAAHLEPEILLIDEVLAVGDASFQKKCLGKMKDVARHGRTILFVSHNMAAVKALCHRGIFLKDGAVVSDGGIEQVAEDYLRLMVPSSKGADWTGNGVVHGNENIGVRYARVSPPAGKAEINVDTGAEIEIGFENHLENINLDCTIYVKSRDNVVIFESGHLISSDEDSRRGFYEAKVKLPPHLLNAGQFSLDVQFGKDQHYLLYRLEEAITFEVENTATGRGRNMGVAPGLVRPALKWQYKFGEEHSLVERDAQIEA
jgi:lipopolysaccharide transport system ATP-binding protein